MSIIEFVKNVETSTMLELERKLDDSKNRLLFLMDHAQLNPSDMRTNAQVFEWHVRMYEIFEESRRISQMKREEFEIGLRYKRERFIEELESYRRQIEEFKTYNELTDLNKYLKKAQTLNAKLDNAVKRIEDFNADEEALEWAMTDYPARSEIQNTLKPFLQLYETCVDFQNKKSDWLESQMSLVDPEQMEIQIGTIYKNLFKLEKQFESKHSAPKHIAATFRSNVEDFKQHLPLVMSLFNPGLHERHWIQISEIVGYTLRNEDGMCLAKLIDMNLEQHIPKFDIISEAATKEYALEKAIDKMKNEWEPVRFFNTIFIALNFYKRINILIKKIVK